MKLSLQSQHWRMAAASPDVAVCNMQISEQSPPLQTVYVKLPSTEWLLDQLTCERAPASVVRKSWGDVGKNVSERNAVPRWLEDFCSSTGSP